MNFVEFFLTYLPLPFQIAFFLLIAALAVQSTNAAKPIRFARNVEGGLTTIEGNALAKDPADTKNVQEAGAYFRPLFTFKLQQERERKFWEQRRIEEQGRK
jgi:hypothetical protein